MLTFYLAAIAMGILKWHLTVNAADSELPLSVSAQCYAGGLFGALFLPSVVGGDVVRLAVGISRSPRPASVITGNFADRLLDLAAQLTLVVAGLVLLPGSLPVSLRAISRKLLIALGAVAVVGLVLLTALPWILRGRSIRLRRSLVRLRRAGKAIARHPRRIAFCWLLGIAVQSTFLLITMLLGFSCGLHLPFRVWLFAWPLSKIAALLPLTQGGVGIRETALVLLLVPFGAAGAQVLAAGIASEGVIIAGGLLAGLCAFLLRRADRQLSLYRLWQFQRRERPLDISGRD